MLNKFKALISSTFLIAACSGNDQTPDSFKDTSNNLETNTAITQQQEKPTSAQIKQYIESIKSELDKASNEAMSPFLDEVDNLKKELENATTPEERDQLLSQLEFYNEFLDNYSKEMEELKYSIEKDLILLDETSDAHIIENLEYQDAPHAVILSPDYGDFGLREQENKNFAFKTNIIIKEAVGTDQNSEKWYCLDYSIKTKNLDIPEVSIDNNFKNEDFKIAFPKEQCIKFEFLIPQMQPAPKNEMPTFHI